MSNDHLPAGSPNRLRVLAAALVLLEAIALFGVGCFLLVHLAMTGADRPAQVIALAAIAIPVGVALAVCARGVLEGQRWTRGPLITWQLLQLAVGLPLTTMGEWVAGVPLLASAVVVAVLLLGQQVIGQRDDIR